MVDTASLIVGIIAIVVAIVAVIIVYLQIGPSGSAGSPGPAGTIGPPGNPGANGGATGSTGLTGPDAGSGPQGKTGPAGPKGVTGQLGSTGTVGNRGALGFIGPTGAPYGTANGPFIIINGISSNKALFDGNQMVIPLKTGTSTVKPLLLDRALGGDSGDQLLILNTQSGTDLTYCVQCIDGLNTTNSCDKGVCTGTPYIYNYNGTGPAYGIIRNGWTSNLTLIESEGTFRIMEVKWSPT